MDDLPEDSLELENEPVATPPAAAPEKANVPGAGPAEAPENPPAENPAPEKAALPRRSWVYRFFNFLFGAGSPVGRILRPVLRWTAAVVGLFALGLLAGYLLLYQPAQQGLVAAGQQNAALNDQIGRLQDQVNGLQNSVAAANQSVKAAQDAFARVQARNNLLVVIYDVANARTYLAQKDGANLMKTLDKTRSDMDAVQPYLQSAKKDLADELNSRLETVRSVVVRDATLAQSDLDNLFTALTSANDLLFGSNP
jgi:outer membrane murein-binding lipoprotein Lpp